MTARSRLCPLFLFLTLAGAPAVARAELVHLASGAVLSVRSVYIDGSQATIALRAGGSIDCDASLITRVEPDEVPYPEPIEMAAADLGTLDLGALGTTGPFVELIDAAAARHQVDSRLVRALVQTESNFEPGARSPKGAMGLMQLMPATARLYSVANPFDPGQNLEAGVRHLRRLLERYEVPIALAAYNAGEGAVQRFGGIPPFRETRDYVARVLRRAGLAARSGA